MRPRSWLFAVVFLSGVSICAHGADKKRVAVFNFYNAAIQGGIQTPFLQTEAPNIGKAATDLLITKLVQDGAASVIERNAIDKLLAEQNLTNSDRTDPATAAKLGRILGVDGIIMGTITHYDYMDKVAGGGRHIFGGYSSKVKHDIKAKVLITARLVSPDTAEVLAAVEGLGEVDRKGVKVDVQDTASMYNMMAGHANSPIMNECMDKAIAQLATKLQDQLPKLPPRAPAIDGLVADVNESGRLVLNVGAQHGVKVGDHLQVWRAGKDIKDPETGKVLLHDDTLLGEAIVTNVNEASSIAQYNGKEPAKIRDLVKSIPKQP